MSSLISGSCIIRAAMFRLGLGFVLVGLVAAAPAAEAEEDVFVLKLDLLTTQFVHSGIDLLPPYQFSASDVLIRPPDTAPIELGFGSTSNLSFVANPQPETARAINAHWQQTYDGDLVSLPRLLRFEFKGEQANITFRPRSVSIAGKQLKITFLPQSALIERDRLKVLLQPHSVSMLWSKAF